MNAYSLFVKDHRLDIRKKYPHFSFCEVGKQIAKLYRALSEVRHAEYVKKAANLNSIEKEKIREGALIPKQPKNSRSRIKSELYKSNPYMLFAKDVKATLSGTTSLGERGKKVGQLWLALPKERRDFYKRKSALLQKSIKKR